MRHFNFQFPKRVLFTLLALFALAGSVKATHIVGGEMSYRCLGNDEYEIVLTLYRDCANGAANAPFDTIASIGVFDTNTDSLVMDLRTLFPGDDTLNTFLADPCFVSPPSACVHRSVYRDTVTLLPRAGGYTIAYQRCCRNRTVNNIINPLKTGATFFVKITEKALLTCNNSPYFAEYPPYYVCLNSDIYYDHSAIDAEGDSIAYCLCTPFQGGSFGVPKPQPPANPPFDTVKWLPPTYSLQNILGVSDPAHLLNIDMNTGLLQGHPEIQGQFVIGVFVREYRDGELLTETHRDFQYNVGVCGQIESAFFAPSTQCDNRTVDFDNQSVNANNYYWDFDYPNGTLTSTERSPTFTYPDTGTYEIMLIVEPGTACPDTSFRSIYLQDNSLTADYDLIVFDCVDSAQIIVTDLSADFVSPPVSWLWELTLTNGTVLTSTDQHPQFVVPVPDTIDLLLTVNSLNGCVSSINKMLPVDVYDPSDVIADTLYICKGESVELNPNGDLTLFYNWTPSTYLSATDIANPIANPDTTMMYHVVITAGNTACIVEKDVTVVVQETPSMNFNWELDCDNRTINFTNTSITHGYDFYEWQFGDTNNPGATSTLADPSYTYSEVGLYTVRLLLGSGSICQDSITKIVKVQDRTLDADFDLDYIYCDQGSLTIQFNDLSDNSSNNTTNWIWYFGTVDTSAMQNPQLTLNQSQNMDVTLIITTNQNCSDTITKNFDFNIVEQFPPDSLMLCGNVATPLNPNGNSNYVYQWSPSTGLDDPTSPNPTATLSQSQDYTVRIWAIGADTCEAFSDVSIFVPPVINLSDIPDINTCDSMVTLVTAYDNGDTTIWTDGAGNIVGTFSSLDVIVSGYENYTFTVSDTYGCVEFIDVNVVGGPVDVDVSSDQTFCLGDAYSLSAINQDPNDTLTYNWQPANLFDSLSNTANPAFTPVAGNFNFTVDIQNQFGCTYSDDVNLVIIDPDAGLSFDYEVQCDGKTVRFINTSTGGFDYVWDFGDGSQTLQADNPTYTYATVGTFQVTLTMAHQAVCLNPFSKDVTLGDDVLIADFTVEYDNCGEDGVDVTFIDQSYSLQNNIVSWTWDFVGAIPGANTQNYSYYFDNSINLTAILIVEDAVGCIDTITKFVPIELLDLDMVDTIVKCDLPPVQLNPNFNPAYTYEWSPTDGLLSPATNANPLASPAATTTYSVLITGISADTCQIVRTVTVIIPDTINLVAPNDTITCGYPIELIASGDVPLQFTWTDANGQVIGNNSSLFVDPQDTASYTVTVADQWGCERSKTMMVTNQQVDVSVDAGSSVCQYSDQLLTSTNTDPNDVVTYNWTPADLLVSNDVANPIFITDSAGVFDFVLFTENQFGCLDTAEITMTVAPFEPGIDDINNELCDGVATELNPNFNPNQTYMWSPPDGLSCVNCPNPEAVLTGDVTYTVIVSENVGTLTCIDTVQVMVDVRPPYDLTAGPKDSVLCEVMFMTLTATASSNSIQSYEWSENEDFDPLLSSDSTLLISRKGIQTYYVRTTDDLGCEATDSVTVNVVPIEIDIMDSLVHCFDVPDTIFTTNINPEQTLYYSWSPTASILGPQDQSYAVVNPTAGTLYTVNLSNNFGCTSSESIYVDVVDLDPLIDATAVPDSIIKGGMSQLEVTTDPDYSYFWLPSTSLDDNDIYNPIASPIETTTYLVNVTDENGCIGTREVEVVVFDPLCIDPFIFLPSAFSPNGDNRNDVLKLRGRFVESIDLYIYDRWGQKVFESHDQKDGWDGTFKGEQLDPDVYGFYLKVKCIDGDEYFKKGNVTLVR